VGAYGQDVSGVIEEVTAFDTANGATVTLPAAECGFAYRASRFKASDAGRFVVCAVRFRLQKGPPTTAYADVASALAREGVTHPSVADVRAAVLAIRRRKAMVIDPSDPDTRSVGSFFTNPVITASDAEGVAVRAGAAPPAFPQAGGHVKVPAAWLIERAGYAKGRGRRRGAVVEAHARDRDARRRHGGRRDRFARRVAQRVEALFRRAPAPGAGPARVRRQRRRAGRGVLMGARN
jgi:UDP-N-acetylmuramate dehydrogenase